MSFAPASGPVVVSVDAMGGDLGPKAVVAGIDRSLADTTTDTRILLHGPKDMLAPLLKQFRMLQERVTLCDAGRVVGMADSPTKVVRNGRDTSMQHAIDAVRDGQATVCVSCGNTGALMALALSRLRPLPGVSRPAIAVLWPSRNPGGFNILLDAGADIRADASDLALFALMGASYARYGLAHERPRIGLLNIGAEQHKGSDELRRAQSLIAGLADQLEFDFVGFVEGDDIPSERVDVVVTDGFTGNVAVKTGEGTARLVSMFLSQAFANSFRSRLASLMAVPSLKRLRQRIDPRRVNGGVFLGLNGTVVKSHGAADATGIAAATRLAINLAQSRFGEHLRAKLNSVASGIGPGNP